MKENKLISLNKQIYFESYRVWSCLNQENIKITLIPVYSTKYQFIQQKLKIKVFHCCVNIV